MARAAVGWGVRGLAREAGIGVSTVTRFESGQHDPTKANLAANQRAFEAAGVRFTEHGVEMYPSEKNVA